MKIRLGQEGTNRQAAQHDGRRAARQTGYERRHRAAVRQKCEWRRRAISRGGPTTKAATTVGNGGPLG